MKRTIVRGWRTMRGRAYPRVIGANREPSWVVYEILLPLLSTAGFIFVYRALGAPEQFTSFVVLGGAMSAFWLNVMWSMASQLFWERDCGNLELYMIAPTHPMWILLGMAIGGLFTTTLRAGAVIAGALLLFDVHFSLKEWPLALLVFVLTMAALYGFGMMLSSLFLFFGREAWHTTNLLQEPIYFVSGFYFPVRNLGAWVAGAASIVPLTVGLDAMRQLLSGGTPYAFLTVWWEVVILGALSVLFLIGAYYAFAVMERLARRDGKLAVRCQ